MRGSEVTFFLHGGEYRKTAFQQPTANHPVMSLISGQEVKHFHFVCKYLTAGIIFMQSGSKPLLWSDLPIDCLSVGTGRGWGEIFWGKAIGKGNSASNLLLTTVLKHPNLVKTYCLTENESTCVMMIFVMSIYGLDLPLGGSSNKTQCSPSWPLCDSAGVCQ